MTTIATDGVTIAADSSGFFDTIRAVRPSSKIAVSHNTIYALCGTSGMRGSLMLWIVRGAQVEKMPKCDGADWTMLVISTEGAVIYSDQVPFPTLISYPFAMGSGEKFAYGAMAVGATPKEAIEAASRFDPYTGGEIQVVEFASLGLGHLAKKVAAE